MIKRCCKLISAGNFYLKLKNKKKTTAKEIKRKIPSKECCSTSTPMQSDKKGKKSKNCFQSSKKIALAIRNIKGINTAKTSQNIIMITTPQLHQKWKNERRRKEKNTKK